jgi:CspA family cold shock protein
LAGEAKRPMSPAEIHFAAERRLLEEEEEGLGLIRRRQLRSSQESPRGGRGRLARAATPAPHLDAPAGTRQACVPVLVVGCHRNRKWFSDEKGFGFITPDESGKDLFVHHSDIEAGGFRMLAEGARVEYSTEAGAKGPKAVGVGAI